MSHNPEDMQEQTPEDTSEHRQLTSRVPDLPDTFWHHPMTGNESVVRKSIEERKSRAGRFFETPLVVATSFDEILTSRAGQRKSLGRSRSAYKRKMGLIDDPKWMARCSFGPGRVVTFTFAPLLLPLQIATNRAGDRYRTRLMQAIEDTLAPTVEQRVFEHLSCQAVGGAEQQIRKALAGMDLKNTVQTQVFIALANKAIRHSFVRVSACRALAEDYSCQMSKVSETVEGLDRYEGYIVRFEGDQVLLALEEGENLRFVWEDRGLLQPLGLDQEGEAIVVYEQRFAPGQTNRVVYGGVEETSLSEEELEEEERLIYERFGTLDDIEFPSY